MGRVGFLQAGHAPTLFMAFLYFDVSFMTWVIFGPLANSIAPELGLAADRKYLLTAVPILGGAVLRLALGLLAQERAVSIQRSPRRAAAVNGAARAVLVGHLLALVGIEAGEVERVLVCRQR